ncbi:conserved hypothetical protein [Parvibaculum lavamentivorans DS-1]|uniref:DUF2065 domain-containing protein n=1 Tax=Parvibaculum lavamentivorans (strain DS-1 / DSM 13023 / NCIMB 13966) TaxID=402881 RepID=A7HVY6_PARL1|nr:DUF2065 domain-containing protein [Parvibaculum lavamentivorans]ABS64069.1 conserved hypothetical protein [Parvibaculum lavamentivorans DS-1]
MIELLSALGLAIALEGALYAAFPGAMRRALLSVSVQPEQALRIGGLIALALGVVIVWLVRG